MKLLLKIAVLVIVARLMVHTPPGVNPALDSVSRFTLRDLAIQVDRIFSQLQETLMAWF